MKRIMLTLAAVATMALAPPAASATESNSYYDSAGATTLEVIGAATHAPAGDQVMIYNSLDRGSTYAFATYDVGGVDVPLVFKLTDGDIFPATTNGAIAIDQAGNADDG